MALQLKRSIAPTITALTLQVPLEYLGYVPLPVVTHHPVHLGRDGFIVEVEPFGPEQLPVLDELDDPCRVAVIVMGRPDADGQLPAGWRSEQKVLVPAGIAGIKRLGK